MSELKEGCFRDIGGMLWIDFDRSKLLDSKDHMRLLLQKLLAGRLRRLFVERACEPVHLNLLSLVVAVFGSFRSKVSFDLIIRQCHAFGVLQAADWAKQQGISEISVIEIGVANGEGLLNLCTIAKRVESVSGVRVNIVGFDLESGLPKPKDFRDHPEIYAYGEYRMVDRDGLRNKLSDYRAQLIIGDVAETAPRFLSDCPPIGFVSIDVDYYSSAVGALNIFSGNPDRYLPCVITYLDDIAEYSHNPFCGELAAIQDFNCSAQYRKISRYNFLRNNRIFQRANWIDHMFITHILDHADRDPLSRSRAHKTLDRNSLVSQ